MDALGRAVGDSLGGRGDTLGGLGCFAVRVPLATVGHHGDSCAQERPIRAQQ